MCMGASAHLSVTFAVVVLFFLLLQFGMCVRVASQLASLCVKNSCTASTCSSSSKLFSTTKLCSVVCLFETTTTATDRPRRRRIYISRTFCLLYFVSVVLFCLSVLPYQHSWTLESGEDGMDEWWLVVAK